jgi:hypothetical protein
MEASTTMTDVDNDLRLLGVRYVDNDDCWFGWRGCVWYLKARVIVMAHAKGAQAEHLESGVKREEVRYCSWWSFHTPKNGRRDDTLWLEAVFAVDWYIITKHYHFSFLKDQQR